MYPVFSLVQQAGLLMPQESTKVVTSHNTNVQISSQITACTLRYTVDTG